MKPDVPIDDKIIEKITIEDIKSLLEPERPPTDDKEDIGSDKDGSEYSLNSSSSEDHDESSQIKSPSKVEKEKKDKEDSSSEIDMADVEDVITNPYADMPEFFPNQIDFGEVEGLPGAQEKQMEFKHRSILKNKHWDKLTKEVFNMATAKVARPVYLSKVLSLYLIQQERLEEKQKEAMKVMETPIKSDYYTKSQETNGQKAITKEKITDKTKRKIEENLKEDNEIKSDLSQHQSVINTEIQKRIERLEKLGFKFSIEDLAKESKNMLVRMPPYKKDESDIEEPPKNDAKFMKMLTDFAVQNNFIKVWKGEKIDS